MVSTAILKILEKILGRAKEKTETDMGLRNELREDIKRKNEELAAVHQELSDTERELDVWKAKYYDLLASQTGAHREIVRRILG